MPSCQICAGDNGVRVFELSEGSWTVTAAARSAHEQDVNHIAWQPSSSSCLASCSDDDTVKLWQYSAANGAVLEATQPYQADRTTSHQGDTDMAGATDGVESSAQPAEGAKLQS
jgi:WD40 repeat protein